MFSGKTSEMFRRLNRARHAGQRTVLYKYSLDTRYGKCASSHDGIKMDAIAVENLTNVSIPNDVDVIAIDEGGFIEGIDSFAHAAANAGKTVIISALDCNFRMQPFPRTIALVHLAEKILKLHAVCSMCKGDASFTRRIDSTNQALEVIGGADKYVSNCRKCFYLPYDIPRY